MIIPNSFELSDYCAASGYKYVLRENSILNINGPMPLAHPDRFLELEFMREVYFKFRGDRKNDDAPPVILIGGESHHRFIMNLSAERVQVVAGDKTLSYDGVIHLKTVMPRWDFISGSWAECKLGDGPRYRLASYEDVVFCDDDPSVRRLIRFARIAPGLG